MLKEVVEPESFITVLELPRELTRGKVGTESLRIVCTMLISALVDSTGSNDDSLRPTVDDRG